MRKYLACLFTLLTLVSATSSLSAEGQKNIRGAKVNLKIAAMDEALLQKSGIVSIVVELSDKSAIGVYKEALALRGDQKAAAAAGKMQNALIERAQNDFVNRLSTIASDAKILYRNKNVYNGVAMNVDASKLDAIRKMAGVKKIYLIHPKSPDLFNSVPFQNVPAAWVLNGGNTGTGIRVGIIDTGIDYVHANFGGNEDYINDTTVAGDNINYPSAKVVGGTDLVGDAYDANNPLSIPQPDDDPMDCNGHGSHVAGIAAGLGVTTGGTTYPGPYDGTTHSTFLRIGPGVAPGAKLYGIRVFGCAGSTNVTDAAIEWATDPNQDGDTSDHLDVINMSLGAGYGGPDDTSTIASNAAADLGMIVAISAGNAGDTYYILGSPGNASKAITVANSVDKSSIIGGLDINSPPSIAGVKPATEAVFGPDLAVTGPITGNVVLAIDGAAPVNDGCSALTNAAAIAGNIALIDRGICTFKAKVRNAQLAGAIGVIIANNTVAFPITMGDDPATPNPITIPSQMIFQADGTAIKANLPAPGVSATLSALHRNSVNANDVTIEDTLDASSSRGPARISSSLKPDITAVGNTVFSTLNGSGDQGLNISGTSMAAPHIAGAAALMKQLHPTWTPAEIKAALMNTATQDLFTGLNHTGVRYGDGRIGDGRLNMATASSTQVIAFNASDPTAVGLSFGSPAVVDTTLDPTNDLVINGHVTLKNFGATGVTYTPTIENSNTGTNVPGVAFVLPVPGPVTVPATGTSDVAVDLTIDSNVMTHVRDSSVANAQLTGFGNQPRHWLSEETGYLVLTPTPAGPPVLRVPLYVAPRPASAMTTVETSLDFDAATGAKTITPTGNAVTPDAAFPIGVESLVSVFENQENSPDDPTSNGASNNADLKNIGVNYDPNTDALSFGLVTYGNWSSPNEVTLRVYIDDDQDGIDDFFIENSDLGITNAPPNTTDVYWTLFCNADGTNCFFDDAINLLTSNVRDTVLMNTNAMFLSVFAGDLPITGSFNYHVRTFSRDAAGIVDESAVHTFDLSNPGLFTPTSPAPYTFAPMFQDKNAAPFSINYNTLAYQAQAGDGVLLIHHHNGGGFDRAQVLPIIVDANLSVTNTDFADPTFLGNDINYTIKVTNNGPAVATNVVLSDVLDAGTTFVASVPGCSGAGTVTCNLGDIAVGQTVTVTLAAKPIVAGTLTNSATATSDQNDPVPADNTGIATTTLVNDSGTSSHLTLDKTHTPSISTVGGFLGYLFDIRNTGPDDVLSVIVTDTLPDSVSFFNIATSQGFCDPPAGQVITCHLGNIHANEFANIVMTVIPNQAGFITNIATATASSNLDPTSQSTDTDVAQINPLNADLQITNTEDADPVTAGDNITYTVTVTNNGPDTAANVQMTDQLPVESAFQSGTTPLGWNCGFPIVGAMGGTVVCTKDPLNPLETATFTIVVQSTVGAGYSSTASVVASEPIDTNVANNSAVARTSVYRPSVSAATDCTSTDTTTFNSTPIQPQYNTLTSTMDVATPGTYLWDLDLVTFLDTDCGAVLNVKLTSPAGTEVTLSTQNGFCGPNAFFDTLWDDQANNPVTDFDFFSNQIHSPLTVEEALGAFNGEDPNGTWTITIEDFGGSITKLNEWSLRTSVFNQPPVNSHRDFTNNNSTPIPAIGQITSTMNVANSGKVCNLDAITNITHIENDELLITLTSPQGTQVTLSSFNGNVNSFSGTLWDDNAGATNPPGPVTDASFTPGFAVTPVTPESAMAAFNGEDSTGTWTLTVSDVNLNPFELFFPAALNNWSLNVGTCSCGTSDIRLTKDDDPDPVQANDSLHYILTVYNDGPDDATGVRVTDNLPNGAVFVSASPECSASNGTVTCDVGALANGTNKVLDVYVQPTLSGVITNGACADNFEGDPNTVNNCDNETTTVQLNEPVHTDLSINKTDSADPTNVGASFSYTLSVTNNGPDESHGFTVTDTLPAEVTFVSASAECTNTAGTITCVSTGPVAEGATQSFLINVTANTQALVSNQACVTAVDIDTDPANNCDTETTQVDAGPTSNSDLSIDKTDNPDPVQVGASLHYTLTVTNNGPDDANNVVAVDTLHPSMTFVTASAGCTNNSGVVTCNMGTIINGGAAVADIYVVPTLAGPIPNTACVSGFVNDGTSGNNCDTEVTLVTLNAPGFTDLQLQKDDSADPVIATSNFSYTLTVTNNGPDESVGFTISDTLPPQVSYISASSGCSETAGVVTCVFNGNLANGGVASFQILVSADTAGDAVNSACVIADNSDTVAANNCDTEHTTIDPTPATSNADLSLDKTDSFDPLQVGSLLTYTLHIANNGPDNATSITVTDTLHPSTNFLSASPGCTFSAGIVTCSIASLANGASIDLQILVGTNLAGVITNTACVSADFNNDGDVSNNCDIENTTITLTPPIITDLQLTKTASAGSVQQGNNITYTLTVFNDGPDISTGHTITDVLPATVTFVSASPQCTNTAGTVKCQSGPLGNNASITFTVTVQATSAGIADNTACVAADNFDLIPANNCSTASTTIGAVSVDLSLLKTGSPNVVTVGNTLQYTLTVSNAGPNPSTGSTIADTLPGEVNFLNASAGCTHAAGVVTCNIGALTTGNSTSVTINVQVVATGTIFNSATVTGNENDPNTVNNTDTETTTANACVFCDDFEDSVIQPEGVWAYTPAITSWSEDGDNLVGVTVGKKPIQAIASPIFAGCQVCTVTASVATAGGAGNKLTIIGWHVDDKNQIELLMNQKAGKWQLRQRFNGHIAKKLTVKRPINVAQFYTAVITFNGSAFTVTIDGSLVITMNPKAVVPIGTVGFKIQKTTGKMAQITVN